MQPDCERIRHAHMQRKTMIGKRVSKRKMSRAIKNHVKYQLDRARFHDDVASRLSSFRKVAVACVQAFVHLTLLHSIDTFDEDGDSNRDRFQQILELYFECNGAHSLRSMQTQCNRISRRRKFAAFDFH